MSEQSKNTYILITQCLQNGFFLADENRLCLPKNIVARMLVGYDKPVEEVITINPKTNRREFKNSEDLKQGPLYRFLHAIMEADNNPSNVHVINIRDWHAPSEAYDIERRLYGIHCEADTWEAEYLDGFADVLTPYVNAKTGAEEPSPLQQARSVSGYTHHPLDKMSQQPSDNTVTYYDVRSDSVFDFKKPSSTILKRATLQAFEQAFDHTPFPANDKRSETEVVETFKTYEQEGNTSLLGAILNKLTHDTQEKGGRVYVVVIGVYSDIKIKTLLVGLRTRYDIDALIVSDVLTGAPTQERHLEALDYIDKVLNVEIVHSLTELVHVLEPSSTDTMHQDLIKNQIDFGRYRTYFRDKQRVLGDQDNQMLGYLELTSKRSTEVYRTIASANNWLIKMGQVLLIVTIIFAVLKFAAPALSSILKTEFDFPSDVLVITGGLTIAQLLTSFFLVPMAQLRNNINSLVRLRNYLETYSSISALLRFHMTKLDSLNMPLDKDGQDRARTELELIKQRIEIIQNAAKEMSATFQDIPIQTQP